jgi:hypothetical protein
MGGKDQGGFVENSKLLEALAKAHLEIQPPKRDKINPRFKTSYSSLDSIYEAIRLPLAKYGITVGHTVVLEGDKYWTETFLRHSSGETLSNRVPMFIEQATNQGFVSGLTYSRRCSLCSLLGLPTDEDDDGEASEPQREATKPPLNEQIRREQIRAIQSMLKSNPHGDHMLTAILEEFRIDSLERLDSPALGQVIMRLQKQR